MHHLKAACKPACFTRPCATNWAGMTIKRGQVTCTKVRSKQSKSRLIQKRRPPFRAAKSMLRGSGRDLFLWTLTFDRFGSAAFSISSWASRAPPLLTKASTLHSWGSPFVVDPRGGRMRTLSPLRTGLPGSSTLSGRCRSKLSPNERRDDSTLNSRSSSSPSAECFAFV